MSLDKPPQKYSINEHVTIQGWAGTNTGTIVDIKWIYHHRLAEYKWGYKVDLDKGQTPHLSFVYIPEGYLRKNEKSLLIKSLVAVAFAVNHNEKKRFEPNPVLTPKEPNMSTMNLQQIKKDLDNNVLLGRETIKWLVEQALKAEEIMEEIVENPATFERTSDHREACAYCAASVSTEKHSDTCVMRKSANWVSVSKGLPSLDE